MSKKQLSMFMDDFANNVWGITRTKAIQTEVCVKCRKSILDVGFRNIHSQQEYRVSGLCQICQDETFKGEV